MLRLVFAAALIGALLLGVLPEVCHDVHEQCAEASACSVTCVCGCTLAAAPQSCAASQPVLIEQVTLVSGGHYRLDLVRSLLQPPRFVI